MTKNNQINTAKKLPIMEDFMTIQGEGQYSGTPAYFIRIGGCDVGCHWCDVKKSWDSKEHPLISIKKLLSKIEKFQIDTIVITGGEPLIWNLDPLCTLLKTSGYKLHLETSGAYPLSGTWDWICLSPKKNKLPLGSVIKKANELKIIIYNNADFVWAEKFAQQVKSNCRLYLQPEWGKKDIMIDKVVNYTKNNPAWTISLQIHKYMGIP